MDYPTGCSETLYLAFAPPGAFIEPASAIDLNSFRSEIFDVPLLKELRILECPRSYKYSAPTGPKAFPTSGAELEPFRPVHP
jgi:hypothetical protein